VDEPDDVRHGVFLKITTYLRAQFGVVSAGRFPPHVTLAGSLPLAVGETELVSRVREVAGRCGPIQLANAGPRQLWGAVLAFDVHEDGRGHLNSGLLDLAVHVNDAVRPLLRPEWHGHMSLASHELLGRPDLLEEIDDFVQQLDEPYPARFEASRLGIFRFHHRDWTSDWWTDFWWELVDSVKLDRSARPCSPPPAVGHKGGSVPG
jgi:hypothetical protein